MTLGVPAEPRMEIHRRRLPAAALFSAILSDFSRYVNVSTTRAAKLPRAALSVAGDTIFGDLYAWAPSFKHFGMGPRHNSEMSECPSEIGLTPRTVKSSCAGLQ